MTVKSINREKIGRAMIRTGVLGGLAFVMVGLALIFAGRIASAEIQQTPSAITQSELDVWIAWLDQWTLGHQPWGDTAQVFRDLLVSIDPEVTPEEDIWDVVDAELTNQINQTNGVTKNRLEIIQEKFRNSTAEEGFLYRSIHDVTDRIEGNKP